MPFRYLFNITVMIFIPWIFFSCSVPKEKFDNTNFYVWKSNADLTSSDLSILEEAHSDRVHVHFFDVGWSFGFEKPVPTNIAQWKEGYNLPIEPVVYIKNDVLKYIGSREDILEDLARRIHFKVNQMLGDRLQFTELQIDCDWTQTTKDNFFTLLKLLKSKLTANQKLSATIRLHQVKYASKTGIPPVDFGVLMVYNVSDIDNDQGLNSIFNKQTVEQYLYGFDDYTLPLNLALPAYSWAIVKSPGGYRSLRNDVTSSSLDNSDNIRKLKSNSFLVEKSGYVGDHYYSEGDSLFVEAPSIEDLQWAIKTFSNKIKTKPPSSEIIYFQLQSLFLDEHHSEILEIQ